MREVGLPARPEHRLVAMQRHQLLDQDEDHARAQQVEDEPVEADIGRVVGEVGHRHAMAAHRRGEQDQGQRRAVQPAIAALDQVGDRHAARDHHADQQHLPQQAHVVLLAQVRRGQIFGEVKCQHRQHGEAAQGERDDAGDLALAHLQGAGLVKDGGGLLDDGRWFHGAPILGATDGRCIGQLACAIHRAGDDSRDLLLAGPGRDRPRRAVARA